MQVLMFHSVSDFNIAGGTTNPEQVLNNWHSIVNNASVINTGFIVLEHDLFQQTVDIAMDYILPDALAHQPPFRTEPIITCLGDSLNEAYAETSSNTTTTCKQYFSYVFAALLTGYAYRTRLAARVVRKPLARLRTRRAVRWGLLRPARWLR